jgi:hypothetical protein
MAIKAHAGPSDGRSVMEDALSRRARNRTHFATPLGGAPQSASPLPFYFLGIDALKAPDPLQAARIKGWRYPILGGIKAGLAAVRSPAGSGPSEFAGLTHGLLVDRLLQACLLAEQALGTSAEQYQPRLLDVPALQYAALWLEAPTRRQFIALLQGRPAGSAPLELVDDVIPELKTLAAAKGHAGPAASAPGLPPPTTPRN